jgi:hypothetical protein
MGDFHHDQSIKRNFYKKLQNKQSDKIYGYQALRASHYMGLSLFIILLAFFIALTTMSDIQPQKSQPVLSSIQNTFASTVFVIDPLGVTPSQDSGQGASNTAVSTAEALEQVFGQAPHGIRLNLNFDPFDETKLLSADLNTRHVVLENYAGSLSRSLKKVIEKSPPERRFGVEIWLPEDVVDSQGQIMRMGALYDKFMRQGFPVNAMRLVVGGDMGDRFDTRIRLVFDPEQSTFGSDAVTGRLFSSPRGQDD